MDCLLIQVAVPPVISRMDQYIFCIIYRRVVGTYYRKNVRRYLLNAFGDEIIIIILYMCLIHYRSQSVFDVHTYNTRVYLNFFCLSLYRSRSSILFPKKRVYDLTWYTTVRSVMCVGLYLELYCVVCLPRKTRGYYSHYMTLSSVTNFLFILMTYTRHVWSYTPQS